MIEHAPRKDPPKVKSRLESEDERLDEGLRESFPASDSPTSAQPHPPLWDQYPETD
jgi:hypothetical protein